MINSIQHIIILRGCPGVGKTTIAHKLASKLPGNVSVISIDLLRYQFISSRKTDFNDHNLVYSNIKDICKNTLREGLSIIVEGLLASRNESGNLRIDDLEEVLLPGVKIIRIFLTADEKTLQLRLQQKPTPYDHSKVKEWTDLALSTITAKETLINTSDKKEDEVVDAILNILNDHDK